MRLLDVLQLAAVYLASWWLVYVGVLAFLGGCRGVDRLVP